MVASKQWKMSVGEFINEFEKLSLLGEIEEVEEQKMDRFLRGVNYIIYFMVKLYPYYDFDTLCSLCLKLEAQTKKSCEANFSLEDMNTKVSRNLRVTLILLSMQMAL